MPWTTRLTSRSSALIVFAFSALLYANTLGHGFVQDDAIVITENFLTKQGLEGIPGLLSNDTFYGFFKVEGKSRLVSGGRYRPLTPVMFALEYELFGQKPWIGHLMNVLFYGLTSVVVYFFFLLIARRLKWGDLAIPAALAGAMLFAAHPVHTEVVANIKGRDEIMSLLLGLLAVVVVLDMKWIRNSAIRSILGALCFFLALLSKENAITLLAVVPAAQWVFGERRAVKYLSAVVPLVIAAVVFLAIRGAVIGWAIGDPPMELMNNPFLKVQDGRYVPFTMAEKSATIVFILGKYLQLLFFPHPLTHDYYPRHIEIMQWADWRVLLSAGAYIALIALAGWGLARKKLVGLGIVFYLAALSIVSNIIFPVGTNMSERFLFMPSVGWALAITALLPFLIQRNRDLTFAVLAVILLAFSFKTITRNTTWKSNYTLFTTDIETSANSAKLLAATAGELVAKRETFPEGAQRNLKLQQAKEYLLKAQQIHPNYRMSYLLLGNANYYLGDWDEAIAAYRSVLAAQPENQDAYRNLGITYRDAGRYYGERQQNVAKALPYLEQAVQILPDDYESVHSLGVAYGISNQPQKALEMFKRGVELAPDNARAHFNLGLAYQQVGDLQNATIHRNKALSLDPDILNRSSQQSNQ